MKFWLGLALLDVLFLIAALRLGQAANENGRVNTIAAAVAFFLLLAVAVGTNAIALLVRALK
jgi:hypothetical protein